MASTTVNGSTQNTSPYPDVYYSCDPDGNPWQSLDDVTPDAFPLAFRAPGKFVFIQVGRDVVKYVLDMDLEWKLEAGGDATFDADIIVRLPGGGSFGKYQNGEVVPAEGKTAMEVLLDALNEVAPPSYVYPSASLNLDKDSNALEVGQTVTVGISIGYNQNDGGAMAGVIIRKNNVQIGATNPYSDAGVKVGTDPITYQATVSYGQGPIKNDSAGNPYPAGQIPAGNTPTNSVQLRGYYRLFYGPAAAAPNSSAAARALPSTRFENAGNTFLLDTGTTHRILVLIYPATKTLVSVIDLDALNANITTSYIISDITINDADGQPYACKMAVMTNAAPYPNPHFHQITLS